MAEKKIKKSAGSQNSCTKQACPTKLEWNRNKLLNHCSIWGTHWYSSSVFTETSTKVLQSHLYTYVGQVSNREKKDTQRKDRKENILPQRKDGSNLLLLTSQLPGPVFLDVFELQGYLFYKCLFLLKLLLIYVTHS